MAGLMNFGAAARGLVSGYEQGTKFRRDEEAAQFAEEQRNRQRKDWQKADTLENELSQDAYAYGAGDEGPVRTERDLPTTLKAQAGTMARHGKVKESAETAGLARGEKKGGREERLLDNRDRIFADYGKHLAMIDGGDTGHVDWAKQFGPSFNDDSLGGPGHAGYKVMFDPTYATAHYVSPDGQVVKTGEWNSANARVAAKALMEARLAALSPEDYQQQRAAGLEDRKVGATELGARATMRNAETQERFRQDQAPLLAAQARAADSQVGLNAARAAGGGASGAVNNALVDLAGKYAELTPEQQRGAEGQTIIRQAAILKAKLDPLTVLSDNKPGKAPVTLNDAQKLAYPKYVEQVLANPKMTTSERAALGAKLGLTPEITGAQPVDYVSAFQAGGPGKGGTSTKPGPVAGTQPNTSDKTTNALRSLVQSGVGIPGAPQPAVPDWASMEPQQPGFGLPGYRLR